MRNTLFDYVVAAVLAVVAILMLSAPAAAQTGPCPNTPLDVLAISPPRGCFFAAADHAAVDAVTNAPVIDRYELIWIVDGADPATAQPVQRANLGKPTPNSDNTIWFAVPAYPIGQRFRAVVVTVSTLPSLPVAAREVRGPVSNPFGIPRSQPPAAPTGLRLPPSP